MLRLILFLLILAPTLGGCLSGPNPPPKVHAFEATYANASYTLELRLSAKHASIMAADGAMRDAYPLSVQLREDGNLVGSQIFYLDGNLRIARIDGPCGWNVISCKSAAIEWRHRGFLPPWGIFLQNHVEEGQLQSNLRSLETVDVDLLKASGTTTISIPNFASDSNTFGLRTAGHWRYSGGQPFPDSVRFLNDELALRAGEVHEPLAAIPPWPTQLDDHERRSQGRFVGFDEKLWDLPVTPQDAFDHLLATVPAAAALASRGCLNTFGTLGQGETKRGLLAKPENQYDYKFMFTDQDVSHEWVVRWYTGGEWEVFDEGPDDARGCQNAHLPDDEQRITWGEIETMGRDAFAAGPTMIYVVAFWSTDDPALAGLQQPVASVLTPGQETSPGIGAPFRTSFEVGSGQLYRAIMPVDAYPQAP